MDLNIIFPTENFQDLNPLFLGLEDCAPGHSFGPAIRSCYLIHYVRAGTGSFCAEGKTYHPKAGEIFIIRPGQLTTYTADQTQPWRYIWIGFNGGLAARLDTLSLPVLPVDGELFLDMVAARKNGGISAELAASRLFALFAQLFSSQQSSNQYVRQISDYITYNYMKQLSVAQLAQLVSLDRRYASRLFKAEYGRSISQYLIAYRMKKAREFLRDGYTVSQTAKMVGYTDVFNFSKMFRKTYGKSPAHFKA